MRAHTQACCVHGAYQLRCLLIDMQGIIHIVYTGIIPSIVFVQLYGSCTALYISHLAVYLWDCSTIFPKWTVLGICYLPLL